MQTDALILALPKGRILEEAMPLVTAVGIVPEEEFNDLESRKLQFRTNHPQINIIRVRAFDVATFVAFGGAQMGIVGNDVLMEFDYSDIYTPLDLQIGRCRIAVAEPASLADQDDPSQWSHIRIATKYPRIAIKHFSRRGVQAECVSLNGAIELAPNLKLSRYIVDLVSTGSTLRANGLVEIEHIADISTRLIVNRTALKINSNSLNQWIMKFREAVDAKSS
jgi:ATP phosphoribosyltransferase